MPIKLQAFTHFRTLMNLVVKMPAAITSMSKSHKFTVPIKATGFWTGARTAVRASRLPIIDAVSKAIEADPSFLLGAFKLDDFVVGGLHGWTTCFALDPRLRELVEI